MNIIETRPREIGFVLWDHCQNLLDDPRIYINLKAQNETKAGAHLDLQCLHGVQRRMISVDNFFVFCCYYFLLCCCYM